MEISSELNHWKRRQLLGVQEAAKAVNILLVIGWYMHHHISEQQKPVMINDSANTFPVQSNGANESGSLT